MVRRNWFSRMLRRSRRRKLALASLTMFAAVLFLITVSGRTRNRFALSLNDNVKRGEQWTETLSWKPRAFIFHNFLSEKECTHLIELANPRMKKTLVIDKKTGRAKESRFIYLRSHFMLVKFFHSSQIIVSMIYLFSERTSTGTFLVKGHDDIVQTIERRIADFTFLPVENGEGLQILNYEFGQKYNPHFDYFIDEAHTKIGDQRIATVLMYLSDVDEGGETVFPSAKGNVTLSLENNRPSKCGSMGLAVKPKMGDALLFWNLKPDCSVDPLSMHGGCPVIKGSKWLATKWIHTKRVQF